MVPTTGNYSSHLVSDSTGETLINGARAVPRIRQCDAGGNSLSAGAQPEAARARIGGDRGSAGIVLFTLLEKDLVRGWKPSARK